VRLATAEYMVIMAPITAPREKITVNGMPRIRRIWPSSPTDRHRLKISELKGRLPASKIPTADHLRMPKQRCHPTPPPRNRRGKEGTLLSFYLNLTTEK
jgi:hypothetical protein